MDCREKSKRRSLATKGKKIAILYFSLFSCCYHTGAVSSGRMPRKRQLKGKRQRRPSPEESVSSNSLEEDLRLQRLRQKENLIKKQQDAMENVLELENSDQAIDDDIGAVELQYPSTISSELPQHLITNASATRWPDSPPDFSFLYGFAIQQQSPGLDARKRSRLGRWMSSRYLLDNLQNNRQASLLYTKNHKWSDQIVPGDLHCSWDMTCKHHLHSSARTLDVACPIDQDVGKLPSVATTLQGGWGVYQPSTSFRESRIHTSRWWVLTGCFT